jgi:hypothetical protein
MADNTTLNTGSGGDTIASDDISGIKYPRSKIVIGADGVNDGDVSSANPLPVNDAGGSLTVDGTVAATQSGAWNVTNVSGTISLPTGAATAAKQPALGTAGAAASDVITIQGVASMTPVQVSDGSGSLTVDGTVAATQSGTWNVVCTNAGTFAVQAVCTNAGTFAVQAAQSGSWVVDTELPAAGSLADNTANPATPLIGACLLGFDGTTWDRIYTIATGDAIAAGTKGFLQLGSDGANYRNILTDSSGRLIVNINGSITSTISGAVDTELPAAAALTDNFANPTAPGVGAFVMLWDGATWDRAPGTSADGLLVNLGANNDVTVTGTVAVSGTVAVTQSGTWNVATVSTVTAVTAITNALPSGTNTIGAVNLKPTTSGGHSISRTLSAATTNATSVKGSAGQVYGYYVSNTNASPRYLKLYNKATSPTVGTDTPVLTLLIPGNASGVAGHVEFTNGIEFTTGIAFALTTGVADADTGAVAANEIVLNLFYK